MKFADIQRPGHYWVEALADWVMVRVVEEEGEMLVYWLGRDDASKLSEFLDYHLVVIEAVPPPPASTFSEFYPGNRLLDLR